MLRIRIERICIPRGACLRWHRWCRQVRIHPKPEHAGTVELLSCKVPYTGVCLGPFLEAVRKAVRQNGSGGRVACTGIPAADFCCADGKVRGDDVLFKDNEYLGYERTAC